MTWHYATSKQKKPTRRKYQRPEDRGDIAYVINSSNDSMLAIDISDPAHLKTRYFIQDPLIKKTYGIALDGDKILLAGRDARSFVIVDGRKLE